MKKYLKMLLVFILALCVSVTVISCSDKVFDDSESDLTVQEDISDSEKDEDPDGENTDSGNIDDSNIDNGNTDNSNTDNGNTDNGNTDNGNADNDNTDNDNTDNGNTDNGNDNGLKNPIADNDKSYGDAVEY